MGDAEWWVRGNMPGRELCRCTQRLVDDAVGPRGVA